MALSYQKHIILTQTKVIFLYHYQLTTTNFWFLVQFSIFDFSVPSANSGSSVDCAENEVKEACEQSVEYCATDFCADRFGPQDKAASLKCFVICTNFNCVCAQGYGRHPDTNDCVPKSECEEFLQRPTPAQSAVGSMPIVSNSQVSGLRFPLTLWIHWGSFEMIVVDYYVCHWKINICENIPLAEYISYSDEYSHNVKNSFCLLCHVKAKISANRMKNIPKMFAKADIVNVNVAWGIRQLEIHSVATVNFFR